MGGEKKIILFGAGQIGRKALSYFGRERIHCFVDNNERLSGSMIEDVPVVSFEALKEIYPDYQIVISMDVVKSVVVAAQLEEAGIRHYMLFMRMLSSDQEWMPTASKIGGPSSKSMGDAKNVLMVAYHFPPMSGSGVFRPHKFAKYLPEFGWRPIVVAADRPRSNWRYTDQSLLDEIPDCVDVVRITDPVGTMQKLTLLEEKDVLLPFLHDVLKEDPEAEEIFSSFLQSKVGTMEMLVFPCAELLWTYQVVRYIEENLDIQQIQGVYTTSEPNSSHLAGYYLKKKYGLPWVADYRDPWTANAYLMLDTAQPRGRLACCLERILLRYADCNIVVGDEMRQDYIQRFGLPEEKIVSITNGYDEADFEGLTLPTKPEDHFTINYSGILYVRQDINVLLEPLRQLVEEGQIDQALVKFRIAGESREYEPKAVAKQFGLEAIIDETGYVSHKRALQLNLESNLLLLLIGDDDKYKGVFSSKIFDYLRSGRPILAFAPKNGEVDRTLCETGHGKAYRSGELPGIKAMILQEYKRWRSGRLPPLLHSPAIDKFERKALTEKLAQILNHVQKS